MALEVFFSHNSKDIGIVRYIADGLRKHKVKVYLYEDDVRAGTYVAEKVRNAIENSEYVLVLITKNSHTSNYVNQEIGVAEGMDKIIIPLVEVGIDKLNLAMLEGREYISIDFNDIDKSIDQVKKTIDSMNEGYTATELILGMGLGFLVIQILKNMNK